MRIKDFTDTIRHLTDPFNIPEARRMIAENPALTQEQFKAGGIVEPGVTHYGDKKPWETPLHREFEGKKFYQVKDPTYSEGRRRVKTKEYEAFLKDARKVEKGESDMLKLYDEIKQLEGRNPRVWELHADGGWGLERIKRILKKNNLPLDEPRGGLKKQVLKLYTDLTEMGPSRYVKMFSSPDFPKVWDELKGPNLEIVFDAFGSKKYPMTKDIYELLPDDMKKKWKTPESLKSQIAEYLNQEKLQFKHSDEMWSKGTREKAASVIRAKGKGPSPYKAEKLAFRKKLDPTGIIRELVTKKKGSEQVIHHPFAKRYGESMEKLMSVDEVLNRYDDAEDALLRIDSEKARLEVDKPSGWERDLKKWEAVENRIVKQKSIEGITLPKQPKGKNPKLVTAKDPLYYDPERKGLLGRMETIIDKDTGEITYKPKGASKEKTFAGMSDDPLTKKKFSDVKAGKGERSKIVNQMVKQIEQLGCFGRKASATGGKINCFEEGMKKMKTGNIKTPGERANFIKLAKTAGGLKGIARMTGLGLAWEAAFAPLMAAWMMPGGESPARILNELAYGLPIVGETEKKELKRHMGETGFNVSELRNLSGDREYLQMQLNEEINRSANIGGKEGRKSYKQFQIEQQIKKLDEKLIPLVGHFYEGPAGQYFGEEKWGSGEEARVKGLESLEQSKADWIKKYQDLGLVAKPGWKKHFRTHRMGGGIMGLKK